MVESQSSAKKTVADAAGSIKAGFSSNYRATEFTAERPQRVKSATFL
jgi:hypothetical protein